MDKKYPSFEENSPELAAKLEALDKVNAETADRLASWAELYSNLKKHARVYIDNPDPDLGAFTVTLLLSFVMALEDLPDEGDVQAIARRMNEIMVMHPERTGVTILFGSEVEEARARIASSLFQVLSALREVSAAEGSDTEATPDKRTLH